MLAADIKATLMRKSFFAYYQPTGDEYSRIWTEALIVPDTNVILNLYRLPATAREELLLVLEKFKDRLWIPFHVALEIQRRRLTVISSERKSTEDVLGAASKFVAELTEQVSSLQIDKHGLGLEPKPLLEDLQRANSKLVDAIKAVHQAQLDIASSDPIRDRLDIIFDGRVGAGPATQAELDAIMHDAEARYSEKIGPGWADANKDKNPNEAFFINAGIKYQRKFSDLIIWRQLLEHVKKAEKKVVLLITSDQKEDWWWREKGKTIGPQPDLIDEMHRLAGVELFWMYTSEKFLEHAKSYGNTNVSESTLSEVREVAQAASSVAGETSFLSQKKSDGYPAAQVQRHERYAFAESCIFGWLSETYENVRLSTKGFPDFIASSQFGDHGFEVKLIEYALSPSFNEMLRRTFNGGCLAVNEGYLSDFTLVLVDVSESASLTEHSLLDRIVYLIHRVLPRFTGVNVIIGRASREGGFKPVRHLKSPESRSE